MRHASIAAVALLLMAGSIPPASADELPELVNAFCELATRYNARGISLAPESPFGESIARRPPVTPEGYWRIWAVARASGLPSCRFIY